MGLRRESYVNLFDLTSFVLVTPDLVGKERLDPLRDLVPSLWRRAITGFSDKPLPDDELWWINAIDQWFFQILTAAALVTLFAEHLPKEGRTFYRFALTVGVTAAIIEIQELWKAAAGTPISQLMLLVGATLFATTRIWAIYSVQHEARQISERTSPQEGEPAVPPPVAEPAAASVEAGSAIALSGAPDAARSLGARIVRELDGPLKIFEDVFVPAAKRSVAVAGSLLFADVIWLKQHEMVGQPAVDVAVGILGFVGIVVLLRWLGFWLCLVSMGFIGGILVAPYTLDGGLSALFVIEVILVVGCWYLLRREARKNRSAASQMAAPNDNAPAGTAEANSDAFVHVPPGRGRPGGRLARGRRNRNRHRGSK